MSEQGYDWICVGSGATGLAGAAAAADRGARTLLLEKAPVLGGATAYSYGSLWAGCNHLQRAAGQDDSLDATLAYLRFLAGGLADEQRLLRFATAAPRVLEYFSGLGIAVQEVAGLPDHYYPSAPGSRPSGRTIEVVPFPRSTLGALAARLEETPYVPEGVSWTDVIAWGGYGNRYRWDEAQLAARQSLFSAGQGLAAALLRVCLAKGVEVRWGAPARRLLVEDGRVVGLGVQADGAEERLRARHGVLLATGGYEGNPALGLAPSPSVFLAAAAARTSRIRLGPLVYLLSLYNPVRLLEEICMLDHLSDGRFDLGVGRGVSPFELATLNVDIAESRAIFHEALDVIVQGLATGEVDHAGHYFTFKNVRVQVHPVQQPYPPLWYPTSNAETIPWVAEHGFNTIFGLPTLPPIREQREIYQRIAAEHEGDPHRLNGHVAAPKLGLNRIVYVAETDARAREDSEGRLPDLLPQLRVPVGPERRPSLRRSGRLRRPPGAGGSARRVARDSAGAGGGVPGADRLQLFLGRVRLGRAHDRAARDLRAPIRRAGHPRLPHARGADRRRHPVAGSPGRSPVFSEVVRTYHSSPR